MKKILSLIIILSIIGLAFPSAVMAETTDDPYEAFLRAGKPKPGVDNIVGGLQIWNDAETLYVQFEVYPGYCISALHLQVANDLVSVPDVDGDPDNGRIAINEEYEDCLDVRGPFEYDISENGWFDGSNLVIAAHAEVGTLECHEECVTIRTAPFVAYQVVDYVQGDRKDGTDVLPERSDPTLVLGYQVPAPEDEPYFYSLGLGGWIEVEFDVPITNVEGVDDVEIIEVTLLAGYPSETAEVYASENGTEWTLLGVADNVDMDPVLGQTISTFDLGDLELAYFIRVVDTTPVETMPPDGDGFDLDSIRATNDYEECSEVCEVECYETAWAGNKIGAGAAWSRWVRYEIVIECETQGEAVVPTVTLPGNSEEAAPAQPDNGLSDGAHSPEGPRFQQPQQGR